MVNINGIDWRVYLVSANHPQLMRDDGTFTLGCCDNDINKIFIADDLNDEYTKRVLCHELVHACMYSYRVGLNEYQEELLADLIATYGEEVINMTNSIFNRLSKHKKWGT